MFGKLKTPVQGNAPATPEGPNAAGKPAHPGKGEDKPNTSTAPPASKPGKVSDEKLERYYELKTRIHRKLVEQLEASITPDTAAIILNSPSNPCGTMYAPDELRALGEVLARHEHVQEDKVELRGFGSFKVKTRRARLARNPRTGASVNVPARRVPYFKSSNELKGRLNDKD